MDQEIIQINKATPVGKRRVCAYTRVSSKSEDQENSPTYQIEAYTKMIMTNPSYEFFSSPSHFSKVFKEKTDTTPFEYRQMHKHY